MTAAAFDPQAIARRVAEKQRQAPLPKPAPTTPLARSLGPCVTGGDDNTQGRPVPTEPIRPLEDIFDRLERQRAAKAVRSPFGPPDRRTPVVIAPEPSVQRFHAPAMEEPTEQAAELVVAPDAASPVDDAVTELPLDVYAWAVLLARTDNHHDARVNAARGAVVACLDMLATLTEPVPQKAVRAPRAPKRRSRPYRRSTLDVEEITRRYLAGETAPQIARDLGVTPGTIRDALDRAGIGRRDDRATRSGGANRIEAYPAHLVERVRNLYTDQRLTQAEVAEVIRLSVKVVQNVMARHGIEARPDAVASTVKVNNSQRITRRLRDLGLTAAAVRAWARETGHDCTPRGTVPTRLIDAYLAANPQGETP